MSSKASCAPRKSPITPGHQVVGVVEAAGDGATSSTISEPGSALRGCIPPTGLANTAARIKKTSATIRRSPAGPWTAATPNTRSAEESFVYPIPEGFDDLKAAPLLCAGIIGFRCVAALRHRARRTVGLVWIRRRGQRGDSSGAVLGRSTCYACTRDQRHQKLALELGAVWAGGTRRRTSAKLDSAIVFAPAGEIVPAALKALKKGGTLALGGIHMSEIPPLDYDLLYQERVVRSVANNTRQDGQDFLKVAAEIPIHTEIEVFPLDEANRALNSLKNDAIRGAAVLKVR